MSLTVKVFLCVMALLRLSSGRMADLDDEFATERDFEDDIDEADIHEINYELKDPSVEKIFLIDENLDEPGSVVGGYRLELPDRSLMLVEYLVADGGGFEPRITYEKNPLYPEGNAGTTSQRTSGATSEGSAGATSEKTSGATSESTYDATFEKTSGATSESTYDATFERTSGATSERTSGSTSERSSGATSERTSAATSESTPVATSESSAGMKSTQSSYK